MDLLAFFGWPGVEGIPDLLRRVPWRIVDFALLRLRRNLNCHATPILSG